MKSAIIGCGGIARTHINAILKTKSEIVALCDIDVIKAQKIKEEFNLPDNLEPVNILAIGYSDEKPASLTRHEETRMPLSDLIYYCK